MKLLHGGLSPFVRKVMIVAHEKGVAERLERVPAPVNPLQPLELAIAVNPLGKIPALTLDDGTVLYGSTVIAEYLDALDGTPRSSRRAGRGGWRCAATRWATASSKRGRSSASKACAPRTSSGRPGATCSASRSRTPSTLPSARLRPRHRRPGDRGGGARLRARLARRPPARRRLARGPARPRRLVRKVPKGPW